MLRKIRRKGMSFQMAILRSLKLDLSRQWEETSTCQSWTTKSPCISNFHTGKA